MNVAPPISIFRVDLEAALLSVNNVLSHQHDDIRLPDFSDQFSIAIRAVVHLRNCVTAARRRGNEVSDSPSLDHLNALISLMAGIEYPVAGTHWARIRQVSDDLKAMLASK